MSILSSQINWDETPQLRSEVAQLLSHFPDSSVFINRIADRIDELCTKHDWSVPSKSFCRPFVEAALSLYRAEHLNVPPPPFHPALIDTMEGARYRDELLAIYHKAKSPETTLDAMSATLINSFLGLIQHLPPAAWEEPSDDSIMLPIVDCLNVPQTVHDVMQPFLNEGLRILGLFSQIRAQLQKNQLDASGGNPKKLITPLEFNGTPRETIDAFLKDTPLAAYLAAQVPFSIPQETRFEHTHIVGGSGAGKTTLIQQIVLDDLATADPPAMVIIDPKGLLIERIHKLAVFDPVHGRLKDRLVIIDPTQSPSPALNMFHPATKWNRMYSDSVRRQIENQAISNFVYIFSSVGSSLTDKQSVPFTFLVRLLFTVPNATILTLLQLLDDPAQRRADSKFSPFIGRLDTISQGFFETEYYERNFSDTRKQIKARLYSILMRPELVAMFSAPERKLDMFDCLQSRKIVLVNTAMSALGSASSSFLGRYIIALTLNAAFERVAIPREHWNPAYLIIDEFQDFADVEKTPELLRLAREYHLGVVLAHQQMHGAEFNDALRNAISTNTSIKYAAAVEGVDLSYVARDLRCEQSFLTAQRRSGSHARFACFVRNFTDCAVSISVPLGNIQAQPEMSNEAHQELLRRNGAALSPRPTIETAAVSSTAPSANREPSAGATAEEPPRTPSPSDAPEAGSTW